MSEASEVQLGSPLPETLRDHEVFDAAGEAGPLRQWLGGNSSRSNRPSNSMLMYLRHFG